MDNVVKFNPKGVKSTRLGVVGNERPSTLRKKEIVIFVGSSFSYIDPARTILAGFAAVGVDLRPI